MAKVTPLAVRQEFDRALSKFVKEQKDYFELWRCQWEAVLNQRLSEVVAEDSGHVRQDGATSSKKRQSRSKQKEVAVHT